MVNGRLIADTTGDLLVRLQNAARAGRQTFEAPYSKMRASMLALLEREGVVQSTKVEGEGVEKHMIVTLAPRAYTLSVKRVSKPGRRLYTGVDGLKTIKNGKGFMMLSTPKGVLSNDEAKKEGVGGEVIAVLS